MWAIFERVADWVMNGYIYTYPFYVIVISFITRNSGVKAHKSFFNILAKLKKTIKIKRRMVFCFPLVSLLYIRTMDGVVFFNSK